MWIWRLQVTVFEAGHVPGTVLGAGDSGVKETVFTPAGPATLGGRQCGAVGRATALKTERRGLGLNLTAGPS